MRNIKKGSIFILPNFIYEDLKFRGNQIWQLSSDEIELNYLEEVITEGEIVVKRTIVEIDAKKKLICL